MNWNVYFDASALVKLYSNEAGTDLVKELFNRLTTEKMYCSMIGMLEVVSILVRKQNAHRLTKFTFRQAMSAFRTEVITNPNFPKSSLEDSLLLSALDLIGRHNLNASDTIILRSALELQQVLLLTNEEQMLWTADKRLARAATSEGLQVFNPETDTLSGLEAFFPNTTT